MNREEMIQAIRAFPDHWDVLVIGGGATGLGCVVDAAARGFQSILLEQHDFAKGTSSRSTKLIHGGVRYLQQGNIGLVLEALRERGLLTQNAPHLVTHQPFIVPNYAWWETPFYGVGLKIYDLLAGRLGLGPSTHLTRDQTLQRLPTLQPEGLRGGTIYYDGQFDDARLAVSLAQTAVDLGAVVLNYCPVIDLLKTNGITRGVVARDLESGDEFSLTARVVINATGVFADTIRRIDEPAAEPIIAASQGIHLVLDRSFLPGDSAIMVPRTDDGRVIFVVPWQNRALLGTTDTPVSQPQLEPQALAAEIDFLLEHAGRYLTKVPGRDDILSLFAGLRPLHRSGAIRDTALLPRDHLVLVSRSGLVTVTGGKWTTYRKMAEDALNQAIVAGGLPDRPSRSARLRLHGWTGPGPSPAGASGDCRSAGYGADWPEIEALVVEHPDWNERLHPDLPYRVVDVVWAVRREMARTVEDVLARRTRALLLDARASIAAASGVAQIMARELQRPPAWVDGQVTAFTRLARQYLPAPPQS